MKSIKELIISNDLEELHHYIDHFEQILELCAKRNRQCLTIKEELEMLKNRLKEVFKMKTA